jgi:hypothetical protein
VFEEKPNSYLHDRGIYHGSGMFGEKRKLIIENKIAN